MRRNWPYLFLFLVSACAQRKSSLPPEYKNLIYKPGDCIAFQTDSYYATTAIYDVKKDSNGLWYAMCFLDLTDSIPPTVEQLEKSRLSGRKVETASGNDYIIGIDIEWLHESCIVINREKTKLIGHYAFKRKQIMSEGKSNDYHDLLVAYQMAIQRRASPPDSYLAYHEKKGADFRPEEYFPIQDFIIRGTSK
jgi:hypothetical protein